MYVSVVRRSHAKCADDDGRQPTRCRPLVDDRAVTAVRVGADGAYLAQSFGCLVTVVAGGEGDERMRITERPITRRVVVLFYFYYFHYCYYHFSHPIVSRVQRPTTGKHVTRLSSFRRHRRRHQEVPLYYYLFIYLFSFVFVLARK